MARNVVVRKVHSANVEVLEARRLLAAVSFDAVSGLLTITGNEFNNGYQLKASNGNLVVNNRAALSYPLEQVRRIEFRGNGGNDFFRLQSNLQIPVWADGGAGNDTIYAGAGNDTLYGGGRRDVLWGGAGDDEIHGGFGVDRLYGNSDIDTLEGGGAARDIISTGDGNDVVIDGSGDDVDTGSAAEFRAPAKSQFKSELFIGQVSGYDPAQIRRAYNFPSMEIGGSYLGAGQTIYIVNAFNGENIVGDLTAFCRQFSLPLPNAGNFQIVYASGQAPAVDSGWSGEINLDVQWARAMAPQAKIVLVLADSSIDYDMLNATRIAANMAAANGGGVVSMSFGYIGQDFLPDNVAQWDQVFASNANRNVTFVASTGDYGGQLSYPAISPYVTAVGGTSLYLDQDGNRVGEEEAWADGGGGQTRNYLVPGYQQGIYTTNPTTGARTPLTSRGVPDVSFNADPATGFAVFSTTPLDGDTGWFTVGGTSASAPCWAGLVASINQARRANGLEPIGGKLNGALYELYRAGNTRGMRDILVGSLDGVASLDAGVGYDLATGLGTPNAQRLIRQLAGYQPFYLSQQFTYKAVFYSSPDTGSSAGLDPLFGQPRSGTGVVQGSNLLNFTFQTSESNRWIDPSNIARLDTYSVQLYRARSATNPLAGRIYGSGYATIRNADLYSQPASATFALRFEGNWWTDSNGQTHFHISFNAVNPTTGQDVPESPFARSVTDVYLGAWYGGTIEG